MFIIALLAVFVGFISYKVATIETSIHVIANQKQVIPQVINGIDGKDGARGITGKNGLDGKNGKDSQSTYLKEVFYTPTDVIKGEKGDPGVAGKDAPVQEIRINPETKNLETKTTADRYWFIIVSCSEMLKSCPGDSITENTGGQ